MKKLLSLVVLAFALSVGVSVAFAGHGVGTSTVTPSCGGTTASNCNTQNASLGQAGSATASATNTGTDKWSDTVAVAVSSNDASIVQSAGQFTDGGSNASTQSAGVVQAGVATATATNNTSGTYADHNVVIAKAIADNDAAVSQKAWQVSFWGASNTNTQTMSGTQAANAAATASNMGGDGQWVKAFAGSFNDGWICQAIHQLAFP